MSLSFNMPCPTCVHSTCKQNDSIMLFYFLFLVPLGLVTYLSINSSIPRQYVFGQVVSFALSSQNHHSNTLIIMIYHVTQGTPRSLRFKLKVFFSECEDITMQPQICGPHLPYARQLMALGSVVQCTSLWHHNLSAIWRRLFRANVGISSFPCHAVTPIKLFTSWVSVILFFVCVSVTLFMSYFLIWY